MAGAKGRSGRKPNQLGIYFREAMRDIATSDKVIKLIEAQAQTDPIFALRVAEHGFGRPFQAVHVTRGSDDGIYKSEFADGQPVHSPAVAELPN